MTARIFRSLRIHRNYRLFFTGQIVSLESTTYPGTTQEIIMDLSDRILFVDDDEHVSPHWLDALRLPCFATATSAPATPR